VNVVRHLLSPSKSSKSDTRMLIVKHSLGKMLVNLLLTSSFFKRHFAVSTWGKSYVIRRTMPVEKLIKNEITEDTIFTLKFKYHSSHSVLKEYVAEIDYHDYENQNLYLKIWPGEQRTDLIKQKVLALTKQTNEILNKLLKTRIFNEKYGDDYSYFITLNLDPDIVKAAEDNRQFSEVTLKYVLRPHNKKAEMRHKSKFDISKGEARKLCTMISYWQV
jgi:hypothetical protein